MMKKLIVPWIVLLSFLSLSLAIFMQAALAQETNSAAKILKITNPQHSNNIQVGEILTRRIELEIQSPYQLSAETLPMKGARKNGMELHDIDVKTSSGKQAKNYVITLQYQLFAAEFTPVVLQLPAEKFAITGGEKALSVNLPAWQFWFSPLVPKGIGNAKENMQPQLKPTLIDVRAHHLRFWLALSALIIGLTGLIYINADKRWLPFMNGAFATAHRRIKKLPQNQHGEKQALVYMHQAFNQINGANLFVNQLDEFLNHYPAFAQFKTQIEAFFERSNQSLFGDKTQSTAELISNLVMLSRQLRDCERGV